MEGKPRKKHKENDAFLLSILKHAESKTQKYRPLKTLQRLLMYLFSSNQEVPTPDWAIILRQHLLTKCTLVHVECDNRLILHYLPQFERAASEAAKLELIKLLAEGAKSDFWTELLANERREEGVRKLIDEQYAGQSYEQRLLQKYSKFVLQKDQQVENGYPCSLFPIYEGYLVSRPSARWAEVKFQNRILSLDCEMVQSVHGPMLARLTLVNYNYQVLFDELVAPEHPVINYLTKFSGITQELLSTARLTFQQAQQLFLQYVTQQTILIGHSLDNDLKALKIIHGRAIDTSLLYLMRGHRQKLKFLAAKKLNISIQNCSHDSKEDAIATMALARLEIQIISPITPQQVLDFDVLRFLLKAGPVLLLDQKSKLAPMVDLGAHSDDACTPVSGVERLKRLNSWDEGGKIRPRVAILPLGFQQSLDQSWANFYQKLFAQLNKNVQSLKENQLTIVCFSPRADVLLNLDGPKMGQARCLFISR